MKISTSFSFALLALFSTALLGACDEGPSGVALGTLERDRVALTATADEVIVALPVSRGTYVDKGTVLVRLDDRGQKAEVERWTAEVALAQANLDEKRAGPREEDIAQARAQVAASQAKVVEAETAFTRFEKLVSSGTTSQAKYDLVLSARDVARAELQRNQENLKELLSGTRLEDLQKAEAELGIAQANLKYAEKILDDLTVKASRDGWIDSLPWNLGERVTSGSPVAIMLAGAAPYARVYVPEPYRTKIKQGDKLMIHVDSLANPIEGEVRWISSDPSFTPYYGLNEEDRARLMYLAEVQLPDSASELPNGVPVEIALP
ncbi:MAG: HlyD family efflux transporter periplasmic adaptor subunit [Pseudomonadota bacterium]